MSILLCEVDHSFTLDVLTLFFLQEDENLRALGYVNLKMKKFNFYVNSCHFNVLLRAAETIWSVFSMSESGGFRHMTVIVIPTIPK